LELVVDIGNHQGTIKFVCNFGISLGDEAGVKDRSTDRFLLALFDKVDGNLAFALFRNFVLDKICSVFMIDNLGSNVNSFKECLLVCSLLLNDGFPLFFGKGVVGFLLLLVEHLLLRDWDVQSSDFDSEFITACGTILAFSITGLDEEHGFSVNVIVFQESRAVDDSLVGFSIEEVCKIS
jgi:hypothetical protein